MIRSRTVAGAQAGFSMIEVLIALVVLGVGLLGLGLMQTMNLRYTQSAQNRTQAVNLAGALMDTIRSNRSQVALYAMPRSYFDSYTPAAGVACATSSSMTAAANKERWRCAVKDQLGVGAWATVQVATPAGAPAVVTVTVGWDGSGMDDLTSSDQVQVVSTL